MNTLLAVLEKALPVFVMLLLGVICRRKNILSREGVRDMKTFAVNITLPAVMFSAFATAQYSAKNMMIPLVIFSLCVLSLAMGFALCRALAIPGRLSPYLSAGFEAGMLGYALFALLFPGEGSAAFAIIDLGQVLFVFTLYKALLAGRGGLRGVMAEAAHAPTVWAIAAGIAVGASGLYEALAPSGVRGNQDAAAGFVAAPTSAVILLTIGYDLVPEALALKRTVRLVALRLVVAAAALAIAVTANRFLLGGVMHTGALALMLTLPPPYVLPVFADVENERADISSALSVLTLLSLALFMVLAVVYA